jgi:hypothetical protein
MIVCGVEKEWLKRKEKKRRRKETNKWSDIESRLVVLGSDLGSLG